MHELDEPEVKTLAVRGGALSPATSFLTRRRGVREEPGGGVGYGTTCGGCSSGTIGHGSGTAGSLRPHRPITLATPLRHCSGKLGVDIDAEVVLEISFKEIVDVEVRAADPTVTRCLIEAIWAHRLAGDQAGSELDVVIISLSAKALP
jgi:hypothetical protein